MSSNPMTNMSEPGTRRRVETPVFAAAPDGYSSEERDHLIFCYLFCYLFFENICWSCLYLCYGAEPLLNCVLPFGLSQPTSENRWSFKWPMMDVSPGLSLYKLHLNFQGRCRTCLPFLICSSSSVMLSYSLGLDNHSGDVTPPLF